MVSLAKIGRIVLEKKTKIDNSYTDITASQLFKMLTLINPLADLASQYRAFPVDWLNSVLRSFYNFSAT